MSSSEPLTTNSNKSATKNTVQNKEEKHFSLKTFISGGIAGSVAKSLVAPIDRCKILLQVHNVHYEGFGVFESFYRIVQKEGFFSLYNGNGAQMLRIFPYAAMQFTSYETFKRLNAQIFGTEANDRIMNNLVCGSLAGITAVTVTYPLDVIRSRLAFQFKSEKVYNGISDAIRKIHSEQNSIRAFYRGYSITVLGMIPYAGLSFSSFEFIKKKIVHNKNDFLTKEITKNPLSSDHSNNNNTPDSTKYYVLTVPGKLICGGLTGIVAQTITYPLDVVRRHMQLVTMLTDSAARQNMGIYETFLYVINKYGVTGGLYRGITLNYIRAIPMVSTSFCFYELSKNFLGLDTSQKVV